MSRILLALLAVVGLSIVTAQKAEAAYAFSGVSVIDTEQSCQKVNDGSDKCYTWIRINGVLRRGSAGEYFSEARGGYVAVLCTAAKYHGARDGDLYNFDYDFNRVSGGHFHWRPMTNNGYCWSPSDSSFTPWRGYPWPQLPNRRPL